MDKIGARQRWAWLTGGVSAAVAACACGMGWHWVLLGGLAASALALLLDRRLRPCGLALLLPGRFGALGSGLAALTFLWTVLAMAWAANLADWAFPMVDGYPVLGWTLLALAAWGSWKGPAACGACAGVLCLFLLFLYGMIAGFAIPDVQLENLRPAGPWQQSLWAFGLFLLPFGVWYAPCRSGGGLGKRPSWWLYLLPPGAAALLAAVTSGVLTPELAASQPAALYTLAQSVSLFGVVERIEPLLSAAMTMGVFCLLSSMACACQALGSRRWIGPAACGLSAALMSPAKTLPLSLITSCGAVFWVLVPLIAVMGSRRKQKPRP